MKPLLLFIWSLEIPQHDLGLHIIPSTIQHRTMVPDWIWQYQYSDGYYAGR
jgi:hypothetical protein